MRILSRKCGGFLSQPAVVLYKDITMNMIFTIFITIMALTFVYKPILMGVGTIIVYELLKRVIKLVINKLKIELPYKVLIIGDNSVQQLFMPRPKGVSKSVSLDYVYAPNNSVHKDGYTLHNFGGNGDCLRRCVAYLDGHTYHQSEANVHLVSNKFGGIPEQYNPVKRGDPLVHPRGIYVSYSHGSGHAYVYERTELIWHHVSKDKWTMLDKMVPFKIPHSLIHADFEDVIEQEQFAESQPILGKRGKRHREIEQEAKFLSHEERLQKYRVMETKAEQISKHRKIDSIYTFYVAQIPSTNFVMTIDALGPATKNMVITGTEVNIPLKPKPKAVNMIPIEYRQGFQLNLPKLTGACGSFGPYMYLKADGSHKNPVTNTQKRKTDRELARALYELGVRSSNSMWNEQRPILYHILKTYLKSIGRRLPTTSMIQKPRGRHPAKKPIIPLAVDTDVPVFVNTWNSYKEGGKMFKPQEPKGKYIPKKKAFDIFRKPIAGRNDVNPDHIHKIAMTKIHTYPKGVYTAWCKIFTGLKPLPHKFNKAEFVEDYRQLRLEIRGEETEELQGHAIKIEVDKETPPPTKEEPVKEMKEDTPRIKVVEEEAPPIKEEKQPDRRAPYANGPRTEPKYDGLVETQVRDHILNKSNLAAPDVASIVAMYNSIKWINWSETDKQKSQMPTVNECIKQITLRNLEVVPHIAKSRLALLSWFPNKVKQVFSSVYAKHVMYHSEGQEFFRRRAQNL